MKRMVEPKKDREMKRTTNSKKGDETMYKFLSRIIALACWTLMLLQTQSVSAEGEPWIELTRIPEYGDRYDISIEGKVGNVEPADYRIAVYILVGDGWWTKPLFNNPTVGIRADYTWSAGIVTGGYDYYATAVAAFLIPVDVWPPRVGGQTWLPDIPEAVAFVQSRRGPESRYLSFVGYEWLVKMRDFPAGPGPNYFSYQEEDVWVDEEGLHLTIKERDGKWYCTEVILQESFGYGTYVFQTRGRIDNIDSNMVLGLFTWDTDAPEHSYRELDIEFTRWGNPDDQTNSQFVVQPCRVCPDVMANKCVRFRVELTDEFGDMTHYLIWNEGRVTFKSYYGQHIGSVASDSMLAKKWTFSDSTVPLAGGENIRFNFWLMNGNEPLSRKGDEVVITGFDYSPETEPNEPREKPKVIQFKNQPDSITTNLQHYPIFGYFPDVNDIIVNGVSIEPYLLYDGFRYDVDLLPGANIFELQVNHDGQVSESYVKTIIYDPGFLTKYRKLLYVGQVVIDLDGDFVLGLLPLLDSVPTAITHSGDYIVNVSGSIYETSTHTTIGNLPYFGSWPLFSNDDVFYYAERRKVRFEDGMLILDNFPISVVNYDTFIIQSENSMVKISRPWATFQVVDLSTEELVDSFTITPARVLWGGSGIDPSGRFGFITSYAGAVGEVDIIDMKTHEIIQTHRGIGDYTGSVDFSIDGKVAFLGSYGNSYYGGGGISIVDISTMDIVNFYHQFGARRVKVGPDGLIYANVKFVDHFGNGKILQGTKDKRGINVLEWDVDRGLVLVKSFYLDFYHDYKMGDPIVIKP